MKLKIIFTLPGLGCTIPLFLVLMLLLTFCKDRCTILSQLQSLKFDEKLHQPFLLKCKQKYTLK